MNGGAKIFLLITLLSCGPTQHEVQAPTGRDASEMAVGTPTHYVIAASELDFADVKDIFKNACRGCHGLTPAEGARSFVGKNSEISRELIFANLAAIRKTVLSKSATNVMPPSDLSFKQTVPGKKLSAWLKGGADIPKD